jgi:diadenosine tetraphosphate (Ap4A) HIT family hydrolase
VGCTFCEQDLSKARFFEGHGWFAFLDSNPMVKGHTIVARVRAGSCPDLLNEGNLEGSQIIVPKIADALKEAFFD